MKTLRHLHFASALAILSVGACSLPESKVRCTPPGPALSQGALALEGAVGIPLVTLDGKGLERARTRQFTCPKSWGGEAKQLKYSSRRFLTLPIRTVVDKGAVPPSGDKHDFFSIGRYFWPNAQTADGLPWVRRDGDVNPTGFSELYDKQASDDMFSAVAILGQGYFFHGEEAMVARAAEYVTKWFVDPATRMHPNLNFAEGVPGKAFGRAQGIMAFSKMVDLLDALALVQDSPSWTPEVASGLRAWISEFYVWLGTHPNALREGEARNNHGTYFDAQQAALALYLGKQDEARAIVEAAKERRIATPIEPTGLQPFEVERANSWFYSTFNLRGLMDLAAIGERVGVDLWRYETADGRGIRKALDLLVAVVQGTEPWPYAGEVEEGRIYELLLRASKAYGEPRYAQIAEALPAVDESEERSRRILRLLWAY